jgi:hypothetical protein
MPFVANQILNTVSLGRPGLYILEVTAWLRGGARWLLLAMGLAVAALAVKFVASDVGIAFPSNSMQLPAIGTEKDSHWLLVPWANISNVRLARAEVERDPCVAFDVRLIPVASFLDDCYQGSRLSSGSSLLAYRKAPQ